MTVPLYKAYGELYIYIAKSFISEHDSHELEGWEVSIGPEEGKEAFHLLFYRQLKSVEGIAWCQDHENWEPTGVSAIYGNNWADTCFYQAACILVGVPKWDEEAGQRSPDVITRFIKPIRSW